MAWHEVRVLHSIDPTVLAINFSAELVRLFGLRVDFQMHYHQPEPTSLRMVMQKAQGDLLSDEIEYATWPLTTSRAHKDGSITFYAKATKPSPTVQENATLRANRTGQSFVIFLK